MSANYDEVATSIKDDCSFFLEDFPNDEKITAQRYVDVRGSRLSLSNENEKILISQFRENLNLVNLLLDKRKTVPLTEGNMQKLYALVQQSLRLYRDVYEFVDRMKALFPRGFDAGKNLPKELLEEKNNLSEQFFKSIEELEVFLSRYRVSILESDIKNLHSAMTLKALKSFDDKVYEPRAKDHNCAAIWWLGAGLVTAGVIFAILYIVLIAHEISYNGEETRVVIVMNLLDTDNPFLILTRATILLSVPVYLMLFSFRNYRINRQNQAFNKHISMSIATFDFFKESFANDLDLKKSVADKITSLIFQSPDFGYLKEGSSPKLIPTQNVIDAIVRSVSNKGQS